MAKVTKKEKRRLIIYLLIIIPLLVFLASTLFSYWVQIYNNKNEKENLTLRYKEILEEEQELKSKIKKLQDPEYIARYAREKYLFSKDGEIIIRID